MLVINGMQLFQNNTYQGKILGLSISLVRPVQTQKRKKDVLCSPPGPVAAHAQKPTGPPIHSIPPGVSMQIPFHQPQIHLPFGGSNQPLQSQSIANQSLPVPLPMHLPVGNPPPQVPPQVFVPGIQHHQGIIPQNPGLAFSSQMGPQLGNMGGIGMGIGPQYQQQPMSNSNFGGARRTVKITHPDTHEELRLDDGYLNGGSSGQRSHPPQSQAFPPAAHPMNFYPSSYNAGALFPQPPGPNQLANAQTTPGSQPPRIYSQQASKQVTVKQPPISSHAEKVGDSIAKSDIPNKSQREGQPHKDSETIAGQSENLTNTSVSVEAEGSVSTAANVDVLSAETSSLNLGSPHGDKKDGMRKFDVDQVNSRESVSVFVPETSPLTLEVEATGLLSPSSSIKVKGNTAAKGKKKIKEILKNADARGTTSDLYNAYKRPEEKKEPSSAAEIVENPNPPVNSTSGKGTRLSSDERRGGPTKFEPDDWEDAADISAHKMETGLKLKHHSEDDNEGMTKKYSRDFLLKFSEHCTDLPEGFEITSDIAEVLVVTGVNMSREPYPSPGRGGSDRSVVGSRLDRRPSSVGLDDKWNKGSGGPMGPGWDSRLEMGYPARGNHGVLRTPRGQLPGQYAGAILSGPMQSPGPHMQRNNSDSERWQRTTDTLSGVIGQIFDKALMEPTFVEMYANFCSRLAVELPGFGDDNEKITFKRLLLNKCQEEFERGEREEEEGNRTEEEGEIKQTEEEREEKRVKARRRMLGNIRLIGELYKKRMLTERIMHECIKKLLGFNQKNPIPDEEDIEALCKLMSTIGEMIDHPKAKEHMDVYFDMMFQLSNNMALSSRVRFMLKDAIDLRKNKWRQQRRKVEGPKKIEEVSPWTLDQKGQQVFYLPTLKWVVVFVDYPQQQLRGYGSQDSRFDSFENRALSVPLRPMGDETITLGPQGGLARGMSVRGQPSSMQTITGPNNGYGGSMIQERGGYGPSRDDLASRYMPERNIGRGGFDRVPPPERTPVSSPTQNDPSDQILSEDRLHDKSIEAIKEFYSARDEKEVALCIKDLNAPGFYPSMISIWVTDSFERKDMDRDSLAKLLINLTRSREGILTQDSLIRGFESVLSTLEEAVTDAPKATEFLGRMLARILLENAIPYTEVWQLIQEGGEEQGRLVETGLAAEVVGVILEIIKSEKGDRFLNDMRAASNLHVEIFKKTSRLDKFI
ncbi:hypothetical protein L1987_56924 [Smallanthus sonchifolius]|uniref:Uncharacterized protein n=1 Tax=Smallanthus sonchifolius TaxID=185202 RepID=A0ACB9DB97_9ASTR|nr:hypothetical protein L1987_56924 [Smallanthus sonchifolius]